MRWKGRRRSDNVEDRRGQGRSGGFPLQLPRSRGARRGGGMGIMGIIIVVGIMIFFPQFGKMILGGGGGTGFPGLELPGMPDSSANRQIAPDQTRQRRSAGAPRGGMEDRYASRTDRNKVSDEMRGFSSVVLADTEDVWTNIFNRMGRTYQEPKMVMFSGSTRTACGVGMRQMGPFYCPSDKKIYIDTAFYQELSQKFGASGDFAQAYVIAHEVGHHVQTLLGITGKVQKYKMRHGQKSLKSNKIQVRMELQADCMAGVWAKRADRAKNILERGDLEEALNAANAIGDDKIQKRTTGYVVPDSFTHGSSKQRVEWFKRGFERGDVATCDTFSS